MRSSGNEGEEDGEDEEGETSTYLVSKNPCFLDHRISGLPEESRAEASLLLTSTEELSNDEVFLACALGLCIEWLQTYFIGLEDIMEMLRSAMLVESAKVGLIAANDGIVAQSYSNNSQKYFKGKAYLCGSAGSNQ